MVGTEAKVYWVYITASGPRGVLYVGTTNDLSGLSEEHREVLIEDFAKRYGASAR